MQDLEQRASDEELLSKAREEAKIHLRKSLKSLVLYGLIPAALLIGASLYSTYERGIDQIKKSHQQCEQVDDKSTIRDTPFGRYSCNEIERFYTKIN